MAFDFTVQHQRNQSKTFSPRTSPGPSVEFRSNSFRRRHTDTLRGLVLCQTRNVYNSFLGPSTFSVACLVVVYGSKDQLWRWLRTTDRLRFLDAMPTRITACRRRPLSPTAASPRRQRDAWYNSCRTTPVTRTSSRSGFARRFEQPGGGEQPPASTLTECTLALTWQAPPAG